MKSKFKKFSILIMAMILITGMQSYTVKAAETATVAISDKTATVGDEVSITVKVTGSRTIITTELWLNYDPKILELIPDNNNVFAGGGNIHILSSEVSSFTVKFKALSAGTSKISLTSNSNVIDNNLNYMTINSGTGSVTVNNPVNVTYSSNNNLTSLSISPGTLSPAFSPDITSYTATVGSDCALLAVSASTQDSTAKVTSVAGKTMDPGLNTTTITVTAEDGSTKKYVIKTTKEAGAAPNTNNNAATQAEAQTPAAVVAAITTTINGASYNVISNFTNHALPSGYTATAFDFNGQPVTVGKGTNGLTIMYLEKTDGSGAGNFYVYDTASKTFSLLSTVTQPVLTYTILPITSTMEIPDNYTKSTLTINGNDVDILIQNGSEVKACLFYGVDSAGKAGWYSFDYTEQTAQKYYGGDLLSNIANSSNVNTQSGNVKLWKIISAAAAIASTVFLLIMIVLVFKLKSKESEYDDDDEYDDNDDDNSENGGGDIFSTIAYNELHNNDKDDDYSYEDNLCDATSEISKSDIDHIKNQEVYSSENASEIGADVAATMELDFEEDELELETDELIEDNDQDNDISDLKDILEDDDTDDSDDTDSRDDDFDDDFEFLDIEDLEDK